MKFTTAILFILILLSCNETQEKKRNEKTFCRKDSIFIHDTVYINNESYGEWQRDSNLTHDPDKDSIWGKPVRYYIEDQNCNVNAIDFYNGSLRPTDNYTTTELLKLAYTDNNKLRPFYRWCLNKTIQIQDGALGEYTGEPARRYAEKFPKEFFEYMDFDTSESKYQEWVSSIEYSGFYEKEDFTNPKKISLEFANKMKLNCKNCNEELLKRIDKFAKECFD